MTPRVLLIDNYDSFTFNLEQALRVIGADTIVRRNDKIAFDELHRIKPTHLVVSAGPGRPEDAQQSMPLIESLVQTIPVLGVCLGHQALAAVFGAAIRRSTTQMHGKSSKVYHDARTLFAGLPNPFPAGRYHSLCVEADDLPDCFTVSAYTSDGSIMGIRHRDHQAEGVQFHPESILTPDGGRLLRNFLCLRACGAAR
jgi:anthranilate synthase/aminodeoxychorismate synthase-like glutamine amidotransferase